MPLHLIANGVTLLFAGGALYVLIGNLFVALVESWLLERKTGLGQTRSWAALIAANYMSAIGGALALGHFYRGGEILFEAWPFGSALVICAIGCVLMLLLTLAIEGWFFLLLFRKHQIAGNPWRVAFQVNLITGVVVLGLALASSVWDGLGYHRYRPTLATLTRPVPDVDVLYYVPETRQVMSMNLRSGSVVPLGKPVVDDYHWRNDYLYPAISPTERLRLVLGHWYDTPKEDHAIVLDWDIDRRRLEKMEVAKAGWLVPRVMPLARSFRENLPGYRVVNTMPTMFRVTEWRTGKTRELCLDIPFVSWRLWHPTLIPDGWCVATLNDHVYLLDLTNQELTRLAKGGSPMVLRNEVP